jgi:hypothetical protein
METPPGAAGPIIVGEAAKAAGKQVNFSTTSPGKARVLIIGFNQSTISDGEIASLGLSITRERMHALEPVHIRDALLSDPNGTKVSVQAKDGGVRLKSAPIAAATSQDSSSIVILLTIVASCMLVAGVGAGILWRHRARAMQRAQNAHGKKRLGCSHPRRPKA